MRGSRRLMPQRSPKLARAADCCLPAVTEPCENVPPAVRLAALGRLIKRVGRRTLADGRLSCFLSPRWPCDVGSFPRPSHRIAADIAQEEPLVRQGQPVNSGGQWQPFHLVELDRQFV